MSVSLALAGHAQGDFALFGELDAIDKEIGDDLSEPAWIATQPSRHIVVNHRDQFDAFGLRPFSQEFNGIFDGGAQVEVERFEVQFAGLNLGEVKDVIDDGQESVGAGLNGLKKLPLFG